MEIALQQSSAGVRWLPTSMLVRGLTMTGTRRTFGMTKVGGRRILAMLAASSACGWIATEPLNAQNMLRGRVTGGPVQLLPSDAAVIDTEETRKDLPCSVTPLKAVLGFDLRFHAGYGVTLPLKEVAGNGDMLTMIFKVTSEENKQSPAFFSQKFN